MFSIIARKFIYVIVSVVLFLLLSLKIPYNVFVHLQMNVWIVPRFEVSRGEIIGRWTLPFLTAQSSSKQDSWLTKINTKNNSRAVIRIPLNIPGSEHSFKSYIGEIGLGLRLK